MAASPMPIGPPPVAGANPSAPPPSQAPASAPAPAVPDASSDQGNRALLIAIQAVRQVSKLYPQITPLADKATEALVQMKLKMMTLAKPGEPIAPPVNG